jgi:hypothetical protein
MASRFSTVRFPPHSPMCSRRRAAAGRAQQLKLPINDVHLQRQMRGLGDTPAHAARFARSAAGDRPTGEGSAGWRAGPGNKSMRRTAAQMPSPRTAPRPHHASRHPTAPAVAAGRAAAFEARPRDLGYNLSQLPWKPTTSYGESAKQRHYYFSSAYSASRSGNYATRVPSGANV